MAKTAKQKAKNKLKRKVKRQAKKEALNVSAPRKHKDGHANVPYYAPKVELTKPDKEIHSQVADNTKQNVHGLLSPSDACMKGVRPAVSDSTLRPTYKWTTIYKVQAGTVSNAATTTNDVYFSIVPVGVSKFRLVTAFTTGYPSSLSYANDVTYSTWSSWVDEFRQVGCEIKVRNTSQLNTIGGAIAIGRCGANDLPEVSHSVWSTLAVSRDVTTHTGGKPGDVFKAIFMPLITPATNDWCFRPPATTSGTEDTALVFWGQFPAAQTVDIEVVTHYEALVIPGQDQLYQPTVCISDQSMSNMLVAKALAKVPLLDQRRSVESDDGPIESAISDVKAIYGAGKRLYNGAKSVWSFVKGLFAIHQGVEESLLVAFHQGLTVKMLRDWIAYVDTNGDGLPDDAKKQLLVGKLESRQVKRAKELAFERMTGVTKAELLQMLKTDIPRVIIEPESPEAKSTGVVASRAAVFGGNRSLRI
jgi:hypothetical protein